MTSSHVRFEDAERPGTTVEVEADPQAAVTPGDRPGTATITTRDGRTIRVVGDHRDVHVKLQAAAATAHETGEVPRPGPAGK